jgi:hypothetical protein
VRRKEIRPNYLKPLDFEFQEQAITGHIRS